MGAITAVCIEYTYLRDPPNKLATLPSFRIDERSMGRKVFRLYCVRSSLVSFCIAATFFE